MIPKLELFMFIEGAKNDDTVLVVKRETLI
jgi:hypothetical protein